MKTTLWILSALLLALNTGCGVLFTIVRPGEEHVSGDRLSGDVCSPVETSKNLLRSRADGRIIDMEGKATGLGSDLDDEPKEQVLSVACLDYMTTDTGARLHHLDPTDADPFEVAVTLAECGRAVRCLADVDIEHPAPNDKYVAGLLSWYSANLDRDAAEARVKASGASAMAVSVFMNQLDTTRRDIEAIVRELDGAEKTVFLDTPHELAEDRVHERAEYAEALAEVAALAEIAASERAQGVSDETLQALETLRKEHVAGCGALSCMRDPVGHAIAEALFLAHISRVDVPAAMAELPYLPQGRHMDRVDETQAKLMRAHRDAHDQVERGVKSGLDAATATAAAGGIEPHAFGDVYVFDLSRYEEPWSRMIPPPPRGRVVEKMYRVKKKVVQGETTTLHFYDHVRTWKQEDCRDTNKIDRVDGGRVYYKQRCRLTGKTESMRTEREPITVPTSEAEPIKAKEWVSYVGLTGEQWTGRVRAVKKTEDAEDVVQLRGVRVK